MILEEQYRKEIAWWFADLGAESEVDKYLTLFPDLNSRLSKFAIGILKWNIARLIDITNPDDISSVRFILKVLDQTSGFDFFDNTFNECAPETVCEIIAINPNMVFFADSYSSWQKGAIGNANKLIQQYISKGTDFSTLADAFIRNVQHKINRRPRKKPNFARHLVRYLSFFQAY